MTDRERHQLAERYGVPVHSSSGVFGNPELDQVTEALRGNLELVTSQLGVKSEDGTVSSLVAKLTGTAIIAEPVMVSPETADLLRSLADSRRLDRPLIVQEGCEAISDDYQREMDMLFDFCYPQSVSDEEFDAVTVAFRRRIEAPARRSLQATSERKVPITIDEGTGRLLESLQRNFDWTTEFAVTVAVHYIRSKWRG